MSGIFDTFSGSITGEVLTFNPDAIPEPDTLHIRMTRGERRIADELRKAFGGFKRVVIDVDGEQYEFKADSLIRLLEGYEGAPGTRYSELFGTPERVARTLETVAESLYASAWADDSATLSDVLCSLVTKCDACPAMGAPGCGVSTRCGAVDYDALLEWLRGDA